jgi:hypothetical protein
MQMTTGQER